MANLDVQVFEPQCTFPLLKDPKNLYIAQVRLCECLCVCVFVNHSCLPSVLRGRLVSLAPFSPFFFLLVTVYFHPLAHYTLPPPWSPSRPLYFPSCRP